MISKLEEMVLIAVSRAEDGMTTGDVQAALSSALGRKQAFGSVYTSMDGLAERKLLKWTKGVPDRGRAPRMYWITAKGRRTLAASLEALRELAGGSLEEIA